MNKLKKVVSAILLGLSALTVQPAFGALSSAEITTLRAAVCANTAASVLMQAGNVPSLQNFVNSAATPTFVVWKSRVSMEEVGDKINAAELAGLSGLNTDRLRTIILLSPNGINPTVTDRRAFFDDVFSGAGGTNTRAALLALWKRNANFAEKTFATGAGSDASPATLVFEGSATINEITRLIFQDNGTIYSC